MSTRYRIDYRTWVPHLDGGEGHAAERLPHHFDSLPKAQAFLGRVGRLHDARVTQITETVIEWHDPAH